MTCVVTVIQEGVVECSTVSHAVAFLDRDIKCFTVALHDAMQVTPTHTVVGCGVEYRPWRAVHTLYSTTRTLAQLNQK